ncbi:hypothetical protein B4U84_13960 [Westiellopsis prolifica IICB1]|nr:hypothetical protein B4U84_13960 [Westiellopsis prolifica IICB1]
MGQMDLQNLYAQRVSPIQNPKSKMVSPICLNGGKKLGLKSSCKKTGCLTVERSHLIQTYRKKPGFCLSQNIN